MRRTALISIVALVLVTALPPAAQAQRTWTAIAGGATKDWAVQAQGFFPRTIEIAVGDAVQWKFEEFHTVTFLSGQQPPRNFVPEGGVNYLNPLVFFPVGGPTYDGAGYRNSGTPPAGVAPGETWESTLAKFRYELRFTKAGKYPYVCLVHPGMVGVVEVSERASGSPAAALARGRQEQAAVLRAGLAAWSRQQVERQGNVVTVKMVGDTKAGYSIFRFSPEPLVIGRGTTVTWKMADPIEVHTATFLGGEEYPELIVAERQTQGPPKIRFHPRVEERTAIQMYEGKGYANSGILFAPGAGPPNAPSEFSLTFTKPGRYEYLCLIHDLEAMWGVVIVK